jgi:hypothetical protein
VSPDASARLSARSAHLFSTSSWTTAWGRVLQAAAGSLAEPDFAKSAALTSEFWVSVEGSMPDWQAVAAARDSTLKVRPESPGSLRERCITGHAVALLGISDAAAQLLRCSDWQARVGRLATINWARDNPAWREIGVLHQRGLLWTPDEDGLFARDGWQCVLCGAGQESGLVVLRVAPDEPVPVPWLSVCSICVAAFAGPTTRLQTRPVPLDKLIAGTGRRDHEDPDEVRARLLTRMRAEPTFALRVAKGGLAAQSLGRWLVPLLT